MKSKPSKNDRPKPAKPNAAAMAWLKKVSSSWNSNKVRKEELLKPNEDQRRKYPLSPTDPKGDGSMQRLAAVMTDWAAESLLRQIAMEGWGAVSKFDDFSRVLRDRFQLQDASFFLRMGKLLSHLPDRRLAKDREQLLLNWERFKWLRIVRHGKEIQRENRYDVGLANCTARAVAQYCAIASGKARSAPEILRVEPAALLKWAKRKGLQLIDPQMVREFELRPDGWLEPVWTKKGRAWQESADPWAPVYDPDEAMRHWVSEYFRERSAAR